LKRVGPFSVQRQLGFEKDVLARWVMEYDMKTFSGMQAPVIQANPRPWICRWIAFAAPGTSGGPLSVSWEGGFPAKAVPIFWLTTQTKGPMLSTNIKKQFIY
jgi:hypothetical protein